jgi:hypothetical protein
MKTRQGLVSNSSSSSFIISMKGDPDSIRIFGFTLRDLGMNFVVRTKEELDKWIDDQCGFTPKQIKEKIDADKIINDQIDEGKKAKKSFKELEHLYKKLSQYPSWFYYQYMDSLEEIKKGRIICFGSCFDQDDNVVQRGLCGGGWGDLPFDPAHEVKVIVDCAGY